MITASRSGSVGAVNGVGFFYVRTVGANYCYPTTNEARSHLVGLLLDSIAVDNHVGIRILVSSRSVGPSMGKYREVLDVYSAILMTSVASTRPVHFTSLQNLEVLTVTSVGISSTGLPEYTLSVDRLSRLGQLYDSCPFVFAGGIGTDVCSSCVVPIEECTAYTADSMRAGVRGVVSWSIQRAFNYNAMVPINGGIGKWTSVAQAMYNRANTRSDSAAVASDTKSTKAEVCGSGKAGCELKLSCWRAGRIGVCTRVVDSNHVSPGLMKVMSRPSMDDLYMSALLDSWNGHRYTLAPNDRNSTDVNSPGMVGGRFHLVTRSTTDKSTSDHYESPAKVLIALMAIEGAYESFSKHVARTMSEVVSRFADPDALERYATAVVAPAKTHARGIYKGTPVSVGYSNRYRTVNGKTVYVKSYVSVMTTIEDAWRANDNELERSAIAALVSTAVKNRDDLHRHGTLTYPGSVAITQACT